MAYLFSGGNDEGFRDHIYVCVCMRIVGDRKSGYALHPQCFCVNNNNYLCTITNVSGSPITVTAQAIDTGTGLVAATITPKNSTQAVVVVTGSPQYFCKFKASAKASPIRAAATIYSSGPAYISIPAN